MYCQRLILICFFLVASVCANATNPPGNTRPGDEITGAVIDGETKKPLANVNVTVVSTNNEKKVTVTDPYGNYYFDNIKTGSYKLVFERTGYKKLVKENVPVKEDERFQMNAELYENSTILFIPGIVI